MTGAFRTFQSSYWYGLHLSGRGQLGLGRLESYQRTGRHDRLGTTEDLLLPIIAMHMEC